MFGKFFEMVGDYSRSRVWWSFVFKFYGEGCFGGVLFFGIFGNLAFY